MNQKLLAEIGRTQRLEILNSLKRTKGMSVNELVEKMKMSYMGIKQHCLTLERDGYLDTWRRPQKMGRPEMVYRLTRRTHDLFQADSNEFTLDLLESAQEIYGPNAAEKIAVQCFRAENGRAKGKGERRYRGRSREVACATQRDNEGYMSQFTTNENGGPQILECHTPIMNLLERFPIIGRLEQDMFEAVLGTKVRREESHVSGLVRVRLLFCCLSALRTPFAVFNFRSANSQLMESPCSGLSRPR